MALTYADWEVPPESLMVSFTVPTEPREPVLVNIEDTTAPAPLPSAVIAPPYVVENQSAGILASTL